jgi:hypothetical protein
MSGQGALTTLSLIGSVLELPQQCSGYSGSHSGRGQPSAGGVGVGREEYDGSPGHTGTGATIRRAWQQKIPGSSLLGSDSSARWSVALPALRTGSPAPCTAHFPPAAARGPMAFGLRLVRHFFLSFFLLGWRCSWFHVPHPAGFQLNGATVNS